MKRRSLLVMLTLLLVFVLVLAAACKHEHEWGEWSLTTNPTATTTGEAKRTCECGETETATVPVLTDTSVWTVQTTPATHDEDGEAVYTSVYGTVTVVLPKGEHSYGSWEITKEPTLETEGTASGTCSCGDTTEVTIPALSDTTVWTVKNTTPSTCTVAGNTVYTSVYGDVTVTLPLAQHVYGSWTIVTDPTSDTKGSATHSCTNDGCTHVETVDIPALSDTAVWQVKTTTPSTCTVAGSTVYTSVYGDVTVTLPLADHVYGSWTLVTAPTLDTKGSATHSCTNSGCTHSETVDVPVLTDSVWSSQTTPADYNNPTTTVYTSVYGVVTVKADDKLVAPYDSKTYSGVRFEGSDVTTGSVNMEDTWSNQLLVVDADGVAYGTAYPWARNAKSVFTMLDAATGKFSISVYPVIEEEEDTSSDDELGWGDTGDGWVDGSETEVDPSELQYATEASEVYICYIDMETGIFVMPNFATDTLYEDFIIAVPSDVAVTSDNFEASKNHGAAAASYANGDVSLGIFVYEGVVSIDVSFTAGESEITAGTVCDQTDYTVLDAAGEVLYHFVETHDGSVVIADGLEGTYTGENGNLVLNGGGIATLGENAGYYEIADGASYTIDLYVNNVYYQVTLSEGTYTATAPTADVTLNFNGVTPDGDVQSVNTVSVNIEFTLPVLTNATKQFKGWFYDEALTQAVGDSFIPTDDVTLYASWVDKVVINLVGTLGDDATVLYLGEGDAYGDYLPKYTTDEATRRSFEGWYLDAEFTTLVPEDAVASASESGITLYAKWVDMPAYVGDYYGTEIWGVSSGNYSMKSISIDSNGNITSTVSDVNGATVVSYDPETQIVVYKKANASTTNKFYLDAATGVIAGLYSTDTIGDDFYIFSRANTADSYKIVSHYGVEAPKVPGGSVRDYYLRFVTINTIVGEKTLVFYNDHIYSDAIVENTAGEALTTPDAVKNSKTVVVKDAEGNFIIGVASEGTSFVNETDTIDLDAYFGVYTGVSGNLVFDGTGTFTWGDKTGTYTKIDGAEYDFDLFVTVEGVATEYHQVTIGEGNTYTSVKPEVEITFVVVGPEGATDTIASIMANIKVAATLPVGSDYNTSYVFNGYFTNDGCTDALADPFIPTTATTIYAKYSNPATLTVVYNNGEEDDTIVYSVGDTVTLPVPVKDGFAFVGWYTTIELTDGTEWADGTVIENNTTIYAKWETAPVYNQTYGLFYISQESGADTDSVDFRSGAFYFDPYGNYKLVGSSGPWPFNSYDAHIQNYNEELGTLEIVSESSQLTKDAVHKAFIDTVSGLIVMNYATEDADFTRLVVLVPGLTSYSSYDNYKESYWNDGKTRAISFTITVEEVATDYTIFVNNNHVYFNVSFKDAATAGNDVAADACYQSTALYVLANDGSLIAKFAYDGSAMQEMDGSEGTYTLAGGSDTIVLNGAGKVTIGENTYDFVKVGEFEGLDGTYSVTTATEYLEYTIDVDAKTYTVVKPMVDVAFDAGDKAAVATVNTNKNIGIQLPVPANDQFVFRGWYVDEACETAVTLVDGKYVPTSSVTLYAKWDAKVTLTIVYGNGMANGVYDYGANDALDMEQYKPAGANNKFFEGWYTDEGLTEAFEATTITADTTVYVKWTDAGNYTLVSEGSYGFEYNAEGGYWANNNQGVNSTTASIKITALDGPVQVKVTYWISSEANFDYLYSAVNESTLDAIINTKGSNYTQEEAQVGEFMLQQGDTLSFNYKKDSSTSRGDDTAYMILEINGVVVTAYVPAE